MKLSEYRNIIITKHIAKHKLHESIGYLKMEKADLILIETTNLNRFYVVKNRDGQRNYPITFNDVELTKLYLVANNA